MSNKLNLSVSNFKGLSDGAMTFSCYGNVKHVVDHANEITVDGAFKSSIVEHHKNGTMPKMFWMHDMWSIPIGKWTVIREDEKGLYLEGEFINTTQGKDVYEAMKSGALDSFSIGYSIDEERFGDKGVRELVKVSIHEISAVTFACNEASQLVDIKSKMDDGKLPTKAELRVMLKHTKFSRKQIERITAHYTPDAETEDEKEIKALLKNWC